MTNDQQPQEGTGDAVSCAVAILRTRHRTAVSFIHADRSDNSPAEVPGNDIAAALDAVVSWFPAYRWIKTAGHHVLYPTDAVWDSRLSDVHIQNLPRIEAATRFVERLRTALPELSDLSEPPMVGDPRASIYTERVSLPASGSIVEHLVALVGADARAVFTIERSRFGERVLHFDRVAESVSRTS